MIVLECKSDFSFFSLTTHKYIFCELPLFFFIKIQGPGWIILEKKKREESLESLFLKKKGKQKARLALSAHGGRLIGRSRFSQIWASGLVRCADILDPDQARRPCCSVCSSKIKCSGQNFVYSWSDGVIYCESVIYHQKKGEC